MSSLLPDDDYKAKPASDELVERDIQGERREEKVVLDEQEDFAESINEVINSQYELDDPTVADCSIHNANRTSEQLTQRISELEDVILQLQAENDALAKGRQDAWQLGYQAGLTEAGYVNLHDQYDTKCDAIDESSCDTSTTEGDQALKDTVTGSLGVDEEEFSCASDQQECWRLPDAQFYENTLGSDNLAGDGKYYQAEFDEKSAGEEAATGDESHYKATSINEDELRDLLKFRFGGTAEEAASKENENRKLAGTRFVGSQRAQQTEPRSEFVVRNVPPDIRKACLVLGLRPEEITREIVHKAWKKEMTNPGTHPDIGGETEIAVYINTAKDTLYRWLDAQAPKLGKKFGSAAQKDNQKQAGKQGPQHDYSENSQSEGGSRSST